MKGPVICMQYALDHDDKVRQIHRRVACIPRCYAATFLLIKKILTSSSTAHEFESDTY